MKVVLFCGGLGTRLREYSETVPKPMVNIGYRPVIWHVMKYYAHYGHKEFILCLGYRGDIIKNYFLNYNECLSNDFVVSGGGKDIELLQSDIHDWKITFVDTGQHSNIGQRLKAVEKYLKDEPVFMANYSDGWIEPGTHLTAITSPDGTPRKLMSGEKLKRMGWRPWIGLREGIESSYASFLAVKPAQSFHVVTMKDDSQVADLRLVRHSDLWINGGFFVFKKEIFDYLRAGEELVLDPFQRLIAKNELITYKYDGFFACMDTFKEKQQFDDMYASGNTPWEVWKSSDIR